VTILETEEVCGFATREVNIGIHPGVGNAVSNARSTTNGEVKRTHASSMLIGGNHGGSHDALRHVAAGVSYGIDAV
jgi:hypothetical protein